ncbi:NADPH-dependent F420 reductase [Streptomyces bicolor]|uniref:NADPH-dependent F420 reductase n=1 Tax=Streptomyces bicolor TaxID=66874 RepID=UPI001F256970|nr:hypothetical protein [Streptomyces bicolor]
MAARWETINLYAGNDLCGSRLGADQVLDPGRTTTRELVQDHLSGAKLVKAFNNISDHHILTLARPAGAADRTALPIAGEDPQAKTSAADLISRLGFDTVDVGPTTESWRFEPRGTGRRSSRPACTCRGSASTTPCSTAMP